MVKTVYDSQDFYDYLKNVQTICHVIKSISSLHHTNCIENFDVLSLSTLCISIHIKY